MSFQSFVTLSACDTGTSVTLGLLEGETVEVFFEKHHDAVALMGSVATILHSLDYRERELVHLREENKRLVERLAKQPATLPLSAFAPGNEVAGGTVPVSGSYLDDGQGLTPPTEEELEGAQRADKELAVLEAIAHAYRLAYRTAAETTDYTIAIGGISSVLHRVVAQGGRVELTLEGAALAGAALGALTAVAADVEDASRISATDMTPDMPHPDMLDQAVQRAAFVTDDATLDADRLREFLLHYRAAYEAFQKNP